MSLSKEVPPFCRFTKEIHRQFGPNHCSSKAAALVEESRVSDTRKRPLVGFGRSVGVHSLALLSLTPLRKLAIRSNRPIFVFCGDLNRNILEIPVIAFDSS